MWYTIPLQHMSAGAVLLLYITYHIHCKCVINANLFENIAMKLSSLWDLAYSVSHSVATAGDISVAILKNVLLAIKLIRHLWKLARLCKMACLKLLSVLHMLISVFSIGQNGSLFIDDIFTCIFLNENVWISEFVHTLYSWEWQLSYQEPRGHLLKTIREPCSSP